MEENFIPIDMEDYEDENLYEVVSIENGKLDLFNCSLVDNLENDSINNVICSETKSIEQQKELCANLRLRYLFAEARFMQKEEELRSLEQTRFEAALEGRFTADESLMMHNTNQQLEQQVKASPSTVHVPHSNLHLISGS
ncbi:unnamed protein product [Auanema sp. JU1783]|nr:unnamed protein product [Auanema sp. JU1783]